MFKIETHPTYRATVTVRRPDESTRDALVESQFTAVLKWLDDDAHQAWLDEWAAHPERTAREHVKPLLVSFEDVELEDGTPVPSNPETIDMLLRQAGVGAALVAVLINKREEALRGN